MKPKVLPDIVRLPGERKLEGVPHAAHESVFLDTPGLSIVMDALIDLKGKNSAARRRYIGELTQTKGGKKLGEVNNALEQLIEGEIVAPEAISDQAANLYERTKPKVDEQKYEFNDEFLSVLHDSDTFGKHLDEFAEYLQTDPKKRQELVSRQAGKFFTKPKDLFRHAINSSVITERLDNTPEASQYLKYNDDLLASLLEMSSKPHLANLDHEKLLSWMEVLITESPYEQVPSKLLSTWIKSADTQEAVVERMHMLATATYIKNQEKTTRKMLEITSLTTDILPYDSFAAICFVSAQTIGSETARQQKGEIDDAERLLSANFPSLIAKIKYQHMRQVRSNASKEFARAQKFRITQEAVNQGFAFEMGKFRRKRLSERGPSRSWKRLSPRKSIEELDEDNLVTNSLLRRWITEQVSDVWAVKKLSKKRILTGNIQLLDISRSLKAPLNEIVEEVKNALSNTPSQELDRAEHWRTLALLVPPDLTQKQIDRLVEDNNAKRAEIKTDRLRSISKRGDHIEITDGNLKEIGFKTLEIAGDQQSGYTVRLLVDDITFVGRLNSNWELIDQRFNSPQRLPVTGAFLEQVILGHVHELLCSTFDEDESGKDTKSHREFHSRRDHRRVLQPGERPSERQIIKAWFDYGVDIVQRNKDRIAAGETTLITWVSEVERMDIAGTGPVRSHASNATKSLNNILSQNH